MKTENAEASMKELEAQNKELLLNKARLEATLEESLLDGKKPVKNLHMLLKGQMTVAINSNKRGTVIVHCSLFYCRFI